jgi:hypothetical protein
LESCNASGGTGEKLTFDIWNFGREYTGYRRA